MNKELYSLLLSYKNKELDNKFINKAFDIMYKNEIAYQYINDFEIIEEEENILGAYYNEEGLIEINISKILEDKIITNKKILTLQVLKHEIEHARNLQRIYEKKDDIRTKVIRYSLREYALNHNIYYGSSLDTVDSLLLRIRKHGTYNIDPGERIAEINSWKFIVNLIKNQRITTDLLEARSMLYYSYINGYHNNKYYLEPPTYEYLLTLGLYHEHYLLKKTFNKTKYNLSTRLLCGLPISQQEYNKEILKKVKLKITKQKN